MRSLTLSVAGAVLVGATVLPAGAALFAVSLDGGSSLAVVEDLGSAPRHIGLHEMLVEGDPSLLAALEGRVGRVAALASPRSGAELYLSYPRRGVGTLGEVGDVLWYEPEGAALVACRPEREDELRAVSFMTYPLPAPFEAPSWFDDGRPAHLRGRTREDELAVRGVVEDVISSVSPDSLLAHVRALSEYPSGESRSRFVLREECLTEAKPYIAGRLRDYLPSRAVVDTQRFYLNRYTCDEGSSGPVVPYPAENIIGVLPGTGRLPGCYVVCAHYDATAAHDFPGSYDEPPYYWWCENPAPGADDNSTGVATVLEAARALSGMSFPCDIRFVLFSGEELGLLGSGVYADSLGGYRAVTGSNSAPPDTVYGVFNVDMIAFKREAGDPDSCDIVTNPGSRWLADWIVATAESLYADQFPHFDVRRIDKALAYSDHASFWVNDYDAVVALENWNPRDRNPTYHTVGDTMGPTGSVFDTQLTAVARMITGAVARLADPESVVNLAVFPDDVALYARHAGGSEYLTDHFVIGEPARVRVDVHAFGPDADLDVTIELWDGSPDSGNLLATFTASGPMGGGEVLTYSYDWDLSDGDLGDHALSVRVTSSGADELTLSDNLADGVPVRIDAPELFIAEHYAWPNPARDPSELSFAYRLSRETEGSVEIKVYDILGQEVGAALRSYSPGSENEGVLPGMNTVAWEALDSGGGDIPSGVYIYRVTVFDRFSETVDEKTGKFALVR